MFNVLFQLSENTFKAYYYADHDEASDQEGTLGFKVKQAMAKRRATKNNDIGEFFKRAKKTTKVVKRSSTVARRASSDGDGAGVSYLTSGKDDGAYASHLIKIEVYDVEKIRNIAPSEHWKLADVRVKYYSITEDDKNLESARDVVYNITKQLASKEDSVNFFIETDKKQ